MKKSDTRNYGLDLLKIIAMFFVVMLHTLGGGILRNVQVHSMAYYAACFFESFAYCAVNVFAIVTGYVSYRDKERKNILSNYIKLWLQVVFYCLIITLFFQVITPHQVPKKMYLYSFIPILVKNYWYFTAYTGVVVFMPFLDNAIRELNNEKLKKLFLIIIFIFCFYGVINDAYGLNGGYTVIWLMILYVIGGIIKKCNLFSKLKNSTIILLMSGLFIASLLHQYIGKNLIIAGLCISNIFAVNYTSPTILGIAILYVVLFSRLNIKEKAKKILIYFSPATFAIYILNSNILVNDIILNGKFEAFTHYRTIILVLLVLGYCALFSLIAMLIDQIRISLFKKWKVDILATKLENNLETLLQKLMTIIS